MSDRPKIVDQVLLGHTNSTVSYVKNVVFLVSFNTDVQFVKILGCVWISQRDKPNLVKCIRSVRDQFTQKDLLVPVQRVNDQFHHSIDLKMI
uniref:Uncharacterized protein n=1 Tax=Meloidogyne incognita TaxID=6306 RepID=A0A914LSX6_MELIC